MKIEVPNPKQETLRFGRVGIIVTVGFVIGIVWPRLAGFKLVPSVPSQPAESSSADLTGAPGDPKTGASAPVATAEPEPAAVPKAPPGDRLLVSEPQFLACKTAGKKRKEECDHVAFDALARPHIQALGNCEGADHMEGALSLGFDLGFTNEKLKSIKNGKSTSLAASDVEKVMACAKKEFANVSLVGMAHQSASYSIFYRVDFPKADAKPAPTEGADAVSGEVTEATGHATVSWDVALVRSTASRDGAVIARVLQGTRVSVTGRRGDWYRVKFDVKGSVGWVYRTAIGM